MFTQLIRIGRDSELRYTQSGKAVCSVACAYNVGYGDNKQVQWIEGALWEKRAESLAQYLVKGQQAMVTFDDVAIEEYEHNGVNKSKLKARIVDLKLCGARPEQSQQQAQPQQARQQQAPRQQQAQQQAPAQGFDDFDSDIPF